MTRRRVTPPISPASCSRLHQGQAASRSSTSFSALVSWFARHDASCRAGSGMVACTLVEYRLSASGLGSSRRDPWADSSRSSAQGRMAARLVSGEISTGGFWPKP